jgi:hypothetical protein
MKAKTTTTSPSKSRKIRKMRNPDSSNIIVLQKKYPKRGKIEIFAYISEQCKKDVSVRDMNGVIHKGKYRYANRLTAANGKIVHSAIEFNTLNAANKNLYAIQSLCVAMMVNG